MNNQVFETRLIDAGFSKKLARYLLDINAVVLRPNNPFKWSSGWNSPIYCDNRLTLRHPEIRKQITRHFADFIEQNMPGVDVITGTATAGIPHAAWVAEALNKPMAYVRAKAKAYGMGNQIEGGVAKSERTVVIEDLISTGTSAISVVEALHFVDAKVEAVLSIFTYGFNDAAENFEKCGVPLYSLTDYNTLLEAALEKGFIKQADIENLENWRERPGQWPK